MIHEVRELSLLDGARSATGVAIVIDVFRAFSTACYAFDRGAESIAPVATRAEALARRAADPSVLLVGERDGKPLPGFDHGNSPSELSAADIRGRRIVLTTSAGTKGLAAARDAGADEVVTGAFVNATATIRYVEARSPEVVSVIAMGHAGEEDAVEDRRCAQFLASLLLHRPIDYAPLEAEIRGAPEGTKFLDPSRPWFPPADVDLCLARDRFDFALRVEETSDGEIRLKPVR